MPQGGPWTLVPVHPPNDASGDELMFLLSIFLLTYIDPPTGRD